MKRIISVLMCLCLVFGGVPAGHVAVAEESGYKEGTFVCQFIPESGSNVQVNLSALYEENSDTLYLDANEIGWMTGVNANRNGNTLDMDCHYRYFTFTENSNLLEYWVHGIKSVYRMSAEAIIMDDIFWIPGYDLLYVLGCKADPLDWDGNGEINEKDCLVLQAPRMTVLDIMCYLEENHYKDICNFNLKTSLPIEEQDVAFLQDGAYAAAAMRDILSGNFEILDYENVYDRMFIDKMLFPDTGYMEEEVMFGEGFLNLLCLWFDFLDAIEPLEISETALRGMAEKVFAFKSRRSVTNAADFWNNLNLREFIQSHGIGNEVVGKGVFTAYSGVVAWNHYQQLNQTARVAMKAFYPSGLEKNAITEKFATLMAASVNVGEYSPLYVTFETIHDLTYEVINDTAVATLGEITGASPLLFVTFAVDLLWPVVDSLEISILAHSDEADALLAACVGSNYETAALEVMDESWKAFLDSDQTERPEKLRWAALLAYNYMRSCSVTIDLAMQGLNLEVEGPGTFERWAKVKSTLDRLCIFLEDDLVLRDELGPVFCYGLPVSPETDENPLNALFVDILPLCEFKIIVEGKVTTCLDRKNYEPVPGANVTLNVDGRNYTAETDENGKYKFKLPANKDGKNAAIFAEITEVTGAVLKEQLDFVVEKDKNESHDVNVGHTLSGTVYDKETNEALPGVTVTSNLITFHTPTTDANGFWYANTTAKADIKITLEKRGYKKDSNAFGGLPFEKSYQYDTYLERDGEFVIFGHYEQDNNTENGKEPIEWIVLETDEAANRMLLISRYALDLQIFQADIPPGDSRYPNWERSDLRVWLNNEFMNCAFTPEEQSFIEAGEQRPDCGHEKTDGAITKDKIWILSLDEAKQYFACDDDRITLATHYAIYRKAVYMVTFYPDSVWEYALRSEDAREWESYRWFSNWWLRSHGDNIHYIDFVGGDDGSLSTRGIPADDMAMVRPVFWLNLNALNSP